MDEETHQAEGVFADEWNATAGASDPQGALVIAAAINLAGLRIAAALAAVERRLDQLVDK